MGAPLPLAVSGDPERAAVLALLRAHGREAVSFQMLEPGFERFVTADGAAAVGYVDLGRTWVTAGGPIAAADRAAAAFDEFRGAAAARSARVVWFGVEIRPRAPHLASIDVGRQPVWDPARWADTVAAHRSLREQFRRARAKGVSARAVGSAELGDRQAPVRAVGSAELGDRQAPVRAALERLVARWLASRPMAPLGFVVGGRCWHLPIERRILVAERDGAVVGVLAAAPIPARGGWLIDAALRDPRAPNGTVELLFDAMLQQLAATGCRYATFGLAPLAGVRSPTLGALRRLGRPLYRFDGLEHFKRKLGPDAWRPVHVVHDADLAPARAITAVLRAFAGGSLLRFGWRTLRHRAWRGSR